MTLLNNPTWTLSQRLRNARLLAGMEQAELARALGVARQSVSNYETGRAEPSASVFIKWAKVTGADLEWLAASVEADSPDFSSAGGVGGLREGRKYTPRDLNPEPTDYALAA